MEKRSEVVPAVDEVETAKVDGGREEKVVEKLAVSLKKNVAIVRKEKNPFFEKVVFEEYGEV